MATPTAASEQCLAYHHTQDFEPLSAQRHPNADVMGSARHPVRRYPVKADAGNQQGKYTEAARKRRHYLFLEQRLVNLFSEGLEISCTEPRIKSPEKAAHLRHKVHRWDGTTDFECNTTRPASRKLGDIEIRRRRHCLPQAKVFCIAYNSDNFIPALGAQSPNLTCLPIGSRLLKKWPARVSLISATGVEPESSRESKLRPRSTGVDKVAKKWGPTPFR